ncbi:hypothetical protein [Pseudomonas phage LUZ7]|uniref:Uncharacterized protein n=1 Tax=Pseudomonas phage LUZ7 TaxID=655097 RepID=C8ZKK3_9CAUD|nr:hypothetical protein PP-LUZ7_gp104 [Pseudomonas phage LUZ7]CAZ66245.1 hypothetical protein [Pseudomonas phage LUZ7]
MKPELEAEVRRYKFNRILYRKVLKEGLPGNVWMFRNLNATFTELSNQGVTREDTNLIWNHIRQIV